jgi:RNA polymerase sigma-70 factor (ECF subfamily)
VKSTQPMPDEPLQRQESQEKVRQIVASMPANLREILLLSYFHQFPYKQISEILNIPLGTVKSRIHTAVAYFADQWKLVNR